MNAHPSPTAADRSAGIAAHAAFTARLSEIGGLRDGGFPPGGPPLPARFLRHCDEQTVVGIHAVLRAMTALPRTVAGHDRDAVVAASCQAGRIMAARSLAQLKVGGAVTVSTHIVPQASLHSLAGAVSVALGMHGPHLGVSGGPDALAEGLLAAITLTHTTGCPRTWLVVTQWDDEPVLDAAGSPVGDPQCRGLAIAIEPGPATGLSLDVHAPPLPHAVPAPAGQLAAFARALDMCGPGGALVAWTLGCPGGMEVRVMRRTAAARRLREAA